MLNKSFAAAALVVALATSLTIAEDSTSPPAARTGVVTMKGKPLALVGQTPAVGDDAPGFTAVANDMSTFTFNPKSGDVYVISAVPSLDTSVCSAETHRFNVEAGKLSPKVHVVTVSMDLPFAQKRWCGAEGAQHLQTVSDYRDHSFAKAYGLLIKESGLLARTVFVVDGQGKIVYEQIVPELSHEPDYGAVLEAVKKAG